MNMENRCGVTVGTHYPYTCIAILGHPRTDHKWKASREIHAEDINRRKAELLDQMMDSGVIGSWVLLPDNETRKCINCKGTMPSHADTYPHSDWCQAKRFMAAYEEITTPSTNDQESTP